jgi:hypothetical protein
VSYAASYELASFAQIKLFRKLGVHHRSAVALAGVKFGLRPWTMLLSEGFEGDTAANCSAATGS